MFIKQQTNKVEARWLKRTFSLSQSQLVPTRSSLTRYSILAEHKTSSYVCFANVHMVVEAYNDPQFNSVVKNADIVTPDGQPVAFFLQRLKKIDQERVAGLDIFPDLLKEAELRKKSVFFYGATDDILQMIIDKAKSQFPALKISGSYSPPFRKLTPEEDLNIIDHTQQIKLRLDLRSPRVPQAGTMDGKPQTAGKRVYVRRWSRL